MLNLIANVSLKKTVMCIPLQIIVIVLMHTYCSCKSHVHNCLIAINFTEQVSVNHTGLYKSCIQGELSPSLKHYPKVQQTKNVPGGIKILDLLN